jgi:hypothetical protein
MENTANPVKIPTNKKQNREKKNVNVYFPQKNLYKES